MQIHNEGHNISEGPSPSNSSSHPLISLANSFAHSELGLLGGVSASYITLMNQSYVEQQMGLYTNNTLDYLEANGLSNATLNDILGYRTIIKQEQGRI